MNTGAILVPVYRPDRTVQSEAFQRCDVFLDNFVAWRPLFQARSQIDVKLDNETAWVHHHNVTTEAQTFCFNWRGLTKALHELFRSQSPFIINSSLFSKVKNVLRELADKLFYE